MELSCRLYLSFLSVVWICRAFLSFVLGVELSLVSVMCICRLYMSIASVVCTGSQAVVCFCRLHWGLSCRFFLSYVSVV